MKKMNFNFAIRILMRAAENDAIGGGMGYRSTTDEWREKLYEAWTIAFRYVNKREPDDMDYFNAKIKKPKGQI